MLDQASIEIWNELQSIPKNRQLHLQCKRSMGAMTADLKPMVFIQGILHPLDGSPPSEEVAINISVENARILKRTLDRFLKAVDSKEKN